MSINFEDLEKVMKLMKKYSMTRFGDSHFEVERVATETDKIVKVRAKRHKKLTEQEMLDKHLGALPDEPWNDINDEQLQQFTITGKVN